jgi:hypothetical protein
VCAWSPSARAAYARELLSRVIRVDSHNDLPWATGSDEVLAEHRAGRIALLPGIEGGHAIENSLGVRYMTLTHNTHIHWVDAAAMVPARHGGLIARILSHLLRIAPEQYGSGLPLGARALPVQPRLSEKGCRREASAHHQAVRASRPGLDGWFELPIRHADDPAGAAGRDAGVAAAARGGGASLSGVNPAASASGGPPCGSAMRVCQPGPLAASLLHSPSMLATLGALITVALGLLGALAPAAVARLVGVQPVGGVGLSEVRATYGGLFLGLGGACLVLQSPVAWLVAGIAWVGAALMRLPSLLLDEGSYPKALGGFALELAVGLLLLSGAR